MTLTEQNNSWFAIQVKLRNELAAAEVLRHKGYEQLVPLYSQHKIWSDRVKAIKTPLFPGYIFCRFDATLAGPILTTPGVLRIVGSRKEPWPINESEILALQAVLKDDFEPRPHPYLAVGTAAIIENGPLAGVKGFVYGYKNHHLILSVHLIQQSILVDASACSVSARPVVKSQDQRHSQQLVHCCTRS